MQLFKRTRVKRKTKNVSFVSFQKTFATFFVPFVFAVVVVVVVVAAAAAVVVAAAAVVAAAVPAVVVVSAFPSI